MEGVLKKNTVKEIIQLLKLFLNRARKIVLDISY